MISADTFAIDIRSRIDHVIESQRDNVRDAARIIADGLLAGGILQAFGTGHSQALTMEVAGRAGGLIPTQRLALSDLTFFGGLPPEDLLDPTLERDPTVSRRIYELAPVDPRDVFVIGSSSGGNGSIVEMALVAKEHGHPLIAVTSLAHTKAIESRHPSGKRLFEVADIVLDNAAPYGDAVLELPGGGTVCAVSSITAALLWQLVLADVSGMLLEAGQQPPVYISANVPGGDEHNIALKERYAGRLRQSSP